MEHLACYSVTAAACRLCSVSVVAGLLPSEVAFFFYQVSVGTGVSAVGWFAQPKLADGAAANSAGRLGCVVKGLLYPLD